MRRDAHEENRYGAYPIEPTTCHFITPNRELHHRI